MDNVVWGTQALPTIEPHLRHPGPISRVNQFIAFFGRYCLRPNDLDQLAADHLVQEFVLHIVWDLFIPYPGYLPYLPIKQLRINQSSSS